MSSKKITDISTDKYDVIIVGGGLSGLSLACLLGKNNINVAIIERADPEKTMRGDERTTAISYGSAKILETARIWDDLEQKGCPILDIDIFDGNSPLLLNFSHQEVEGKSFGHIFLNSDLRQALNTKIQDLETVSIIAPAQVENFEYLDQGVRVFLNNKHTVDAPLVIGADGRGSFVRDFLDIDTRRWSYNQSAVICIAQHSNPHNNVAVEHFWPEGPFAILPMHDDENGNHRSSVVFTEHENHGRKSWMDMEKNAFEQALQARFPERYGTISMMGDRTRYPLSLVHATHYIGNRMALMADAAHGIHPIAGQGLNLGFRDVDALYNILSEAYQNNMDLGSDDILQRYQKMRRFDNMSMVAVTDGLVRLFSNDLPPVKLARRIGLKAVGKLPFAKRFFMKQAMADR